MGFWDRCRSAAGDVVDAAFNPNSKVSVADAVEKAGTSLLVGELQDHDILTPQQASRPCKDFTPHRLLALLNEYTHTNRKMNYEGRLERTLERVCSGSISSDVGTIYSWFRLDAMSRYDFLSFQDPHQCRRPEISTLKSGAEVLMSPESTYPARIWDLCSNRVVPFMWSRNQNRVRKMIEKISGEHLFAAISHSWTADMVMNTTTPVNHYQYPVPLPEGINLQDIRQEILKICGKQGQFCWLDVICNRQGYLDINKKPLPGWEDCAEKGEEMREQEWKTDLPLIGIIYEKASQVVRYYNGLGRRFSSEGWESEKHWRNRVWTLQEVPCGEGKPEGITGGIPEGGEQFSLDMMCKNGEKYETAEALLKGALLSRDPRRWLKTFYKPDGGKNWEERPMSWDMFEDVVLEVNRRKCTSCRDRLIVLAYLSSCDPIPVYSEQRSIEEMFDVVWQCLPDDAKENIRKGMGWQSRDPPNKWKRVLDRLDAHPKGDSCMCWSCKGNRKPGKKQPKERVTYWFPPKK